MTGPVKRLLVVDDDRGLREALTRLLSRRGFECESAEDGIDGFERMRAKAFDLVITDMRMPGKSGLEMILAARDEISPMPQFILLSGYHDYTPEALTQAGASRILTKPVLPTELCSYVAELLAR